MIPQFALRLICGMSLTWCLMPRAEVTAGFFRIQMLAALGLSVLAAMTAPQLEAAAEGESWLGVGAVRGLCMLLALCAFVGSVVWTLVRRSAGTIIAGLVLAISLTCLLATLPRGSGLLAAVSEVSSAWLVGGAVTAMLLGHWYLTAPMMSLAPLTRLTQYLGGATLLRGVLALAGLATLGEDLSLTELQRIWLVLRWSAGLIGPAVLCFLVWRILRYRNTQSATGVLFAGVILTFIGETTAVLLSRELRWPV
jgi:hypothetical protein